MACRRSVAGVDMVMSLRNGTYEATVVRRRRRADIPQEMCQMFAESVARIFVDLCPGVLSVKALTMMADGEVVRGPAYANLTLQLSFDVSFWGVRHMYSMDEAQALDRRVGEILIKPASACGRVAALVQVAVEVAQVVNTVAEPDWEPPPSIMDADVQQGDELLFPRGVEEYVEPDVIAGEDAWMDMPQDIGMVIDLTGEVEQAETPEDARRVAEAVLVVAACHAIDLFTAVVCGEVEKNNEQELTKGLAVYAARITAWLRHFGVWCKAAESELSLMHNRGDHFSSLAKVVAALITAPRSAVDVHCEEAKVAAGAVVAVNTVVTYAGGDEEWSSERHGRLLCECMSSISAIQTTRIPSQFVEASWV